MPPSIDKLQLTFAFPEPGHKYPVIALRDRDGHELGRIPTSEPCPRLPFESGSVRSVDALEILEHVHDEQAWLAEIARVLVPDGDLVVRVPLENLLAWADALNIYRYLGDTLGIGRAPVETLPTGWHRHYAPGDLPAILELAGFDIVTTSTRGVPLEEAPHLAALLGSSLFPNPRDVQRRLFRAQRSFRDRPRLPMPRALAATITVRARKLADGFRPDPALDPHHRPEEEASQSLE